MLDKPKSMCFQDGGGNLVVTVDDIGANWRSKPQDNYKVSRTCIAFGFCMQCIKNNYKFCLKIILFCPTNVC